MEGWQGIFLKNPLATLCVCFLKGNIKSLDQVFHFFGFFSNSRLSSNHTGKAKREHDFFCSYWFTSVRTCSSTNLFCPKIHSQNHFQSVQPWKWSLREALNVLIVNLLKSKCRQPEQVSSGWYGHVSQFAWQISFISVDLAWLLIVPPCQRVWFGWWIIRVSCWSPNVPCLMSIANIVFK